jgi:hypothetical protein
MNTSSWRDVNDPGVFKKPATTPTAAPAAVSAAALKEKTDPEVKLSDPQWAKGPGGYAFNKKAKISVKVDYLKQTIRKRVKFEVFVESAAGRENLNQNVEGIEKNGRAEVEIDLFYGDKYSEKLRADPTAACKYFFKATHATGESPVDSGPLDMPQALEKKSFKIRLAFNPEKADADDDAFILFSTDQRTSYSKTLTVKDDKIKGDEFLDLEFRDLVAGLNYSLKVLPGSKGKSYLLFQEKPYQEIA